MDKHWYFTRVIELLGPIGPIDGDELNRLIESCWKCASPTNHCATLIMDKYSDYNRRLSQYTEEVSEQLSVKLGFQTCAKFTDRQVMILMDLCDAAMKEGITENDCAEEFIRDYLDEDPRIQAYLSAPYRPTKTNATKVPPTKKPKYLVSRETRREEWFNARR